jgi:hypothetical protein
MAELAAHLTDHVLPHLAARQWVLSLPKRLRPFLHHNPDLAGAVLRDHASRGALLRAIRTTLRRVSPGAPADAQLGAVSFLHRFGSSLNPHLHQDVDAASTDVSAETPRRTPAPGRREPEESFGILRRAFASGQAYGIWIHRDMDLESLRGFPLYECPLRPEA